MNSNEQPPGEQPPGEQPLGHQLPPAEQLRRKRLEMLNKAKPDTAPPANTPQSSSTASPDAKPKTNPGAKPKANPFSQLGVKSNSASGASPSNESDAAGATTATPPAKKMNSKEEGNEDWADRILSDLFRVTLDEARKQDSRGLKLTYLPALKGDLEQSGEPIKLTAQNIDTAMVEAASLLPASKPLLDYLLPCFKRAVRAASAARRPTPERQAVLDEAKRLSMSNCIFALTMPELFGREPNPAHDTLVPYLLRNHDSEDGVCSDFFNEALSRIQEDESILPLFTDAMVQMSAKLATMTMNDNYRPYVSCLSTYARYPPLVDALAQHDRFLVATAGKTKEQLAIASESQTILGPFFRISPLQAEVTMTYFTSPRTIDPGHVKTSQSALQMTLRTHQGDLTHIINSFVRAGATARNRTLDWFAFIVNSNHKRRALQVKTNEVASDGFMVNVTAILDQLCQPFMDPSFSKISKVDIDYLRKGPRVDVTDETKLNADQSTSDAYYGQKVEGASNFISEIFFLNLAAHHYGSEATNAKLKNLDKDIKHFQKMEKEFADAVAKLESSNLPNNTHRLNGLKAQHAKIVSVLEKSMSLRFSIEGVLTDKSMQELSLQFMRYVSVWLLRVASRTEYMPGQSLQLPLPDDQPQEFSCLPEYALQDVVDNFRFINRFMPSIMISAVGDEIVALCITFLRSSGYIKNPYLKSSLVTVLFAGSWELPGRKLGIIGDILLGSKLANDHLLHALMQFYIECESSGVSTAFYDRFNIRYEIFQVMKVIWPNQVYKDNLLKESKVNRQFFVQYVNLLLNDATYLLDEALSKLTKIHDIQKKLLDATMPPADREKMQTDLEEAERQCQSWMSLVNETMAMMKLFTETLTDAFTMPEIVGRLATMLDYNLDTLVGPRRSNLKVEDARKYHFDPKTLLSDFIDIYLNLSEKDKFVEAVATDGRSYKPANFDVASRILGEKHLKSPEELARWAELKEKVIKAKVIADQAELDLGETPAEFEDPIMGVLMEDPVLLPSKAIVDRSTIVQHLLSDARDPFNRSPMTIEDIVPHDELRARVAEWKAERIAAAKANVGGGGGDDAMDTTTG